MTEKLDSSAEEVVPDHPAKSGRRPSRRLVRFGSILVIALTLLALFISFAPHYAARYLITEELEKLGVETTGIETLKINLWTLEAWLGPVRFRGGEKDSGQLGDLGLRISFNPLLHRRVSIEQMVVRGIEVEVTRSTENKLALNGIPLDQLLHPTDDEQPTAEGKVWGAGIENFELSDSRVIFRDEKRGELEVDVERLVLREFRTWESQRPGLFELTALVNDIQLNWSGEARPFSDNITLDIDSRTEGADVPKLIRFTGPWGLDRQEGSYDANLKYRIDLFDSGRLEGHTTGSIDIKGADYQQAGIFSLALDRANVELDVRYTLDEMGSLTLRGQADINLERFNSSVADETRVALTSGSIGIKELDIAQEKAGSLKMAVQPQLDLRDVAFSGPIEISLDKLLDLLALLQSISASGAVTTADTGLGDFSDDSLSVPSSDIKLDRLQTTGAAFSLQSAAGQVDLKLKSSTDLTRIKIHADQREINVKRWQSMLEGLSLTSGKGRLSLQMAGSNSLTEGSAVGPLGEVAVDALDARTEKLELETRTGALSLQLQTGSRINGLSAVKYALESLPEVRIELGQARASISKASLDAKGSELRWQATADASLGPLSAEFAKGKEGSLKLSRAEIKALQADQQLQFIGEALTVSDPDIYVKRSLLEALAGKEKKAGTSAENTVMEEPVAASQEVDVSQVQALLSELGYAPGSVDGRMGGRTVAAIEAFQRKEGLTVDGRLTKNLLIALQTRAASPAAEKSAPVGSGVRLGLLALTGNPVIRFRDDLVSPQVKIDTVFKEASVRNLDTRGGGERTELQISADVNEFTQVKLEGWSAGFDKTSDMELNAKVENLELSTLSPYVAELAGVHLESGRLDTSAIGKVLLGGLQGEIQLELDSIAFKPLNQADAERLSGNIGVPLETAVNLLQDGDGRIQLVLPVSGTLNKPDVDISSAVNKAIGSALKSVFPPTMIASLLSGAASGTGPAFEPITFDPGSSELNEAGQGYADNIAELLSERPKLSLRVCGRATAQDGAGGQRVEATGGTPAPGAKGQSNNAKAEPAPDPAQVAQTLNELAVERQRSVRRYLIQEKGADVKRIRACRSTYEAADQGSPRVEISL